MNKTERAAILNKLKAQLEKDYGPGAAVIASQMRPVTRISSGSVALDISLGGGWPVNQWHELIGQPSAGKTALVFKTIAANQATDPDYTVFWVASEYFDTQHALNCGVDLSRVLVYNENIMERALAVVLQVLEDRSSDMVVIDSYPALSPGEEADKAMDEFVTAAGARLMNKFWRKQGSAGRRSQTDFDRPCTCFLVNQWRDKIGTPSYMDPRTTPGGKGKDFAAVVRLDIRRDEWIEPTIDGKKIRVGQTIKTLTIKNKSAAPQRVATFDFYFSDHGRHSAGNYDIERELVNAGLAYGLIERSESWYSYQELQAQGARKLGDALSINTELREILRKVVLERSLQRPPDVALPVSRRVAVRRPGRG